MKTKTIFLMLLLSLLAFISCEDTFEPIGIETRVFGRMYDSQNQLPLADQQLRIAEYNRIPGFGSVPNTDFIQYLDSTLTDSQGFYDFSFTTSGLGDRYILETQPIQEPQIINDFIFGFRNQEFLTEIEDLGESTELNFEVQFLYPVNLKITLDPNVQFLPIKIARPFVSGSDNLTQTGIEDSRLFYIDKNSSSLVILVRTTPEGQRERVIIEMDATNTTDLTEFEIYIEDSDFIIQ
ncbi:MAG: hypothetical protein ACI9Y7_001412 [Dokdonia sp.]|jgi:hypothetical protein